MPPNLNAAALDPIRNVVSASFLYPFKGILYFCTKREYWPLFGRRLIPLTILSIVVLALLFTFTYLPQAAFLLIFHGPTAWVSAVFLVLGEGNLLIALLFEGFLVDETLVDVFDIAEFILFLPLNLIPVIGVPFFLVLTGARAGPLHHWRWFKLRGLTKKERNKEIAKRKWKYTWFGTMALLLQLVPVFSMFFLLTSACGSALWVVKLEEQRRLLEEAPRLADDGAPPPYTDDPI
ncbi:hypothetical protein HYFRA_00005676 [Hymenoscyphus fraxineus]|uniref:Uncharacterized protein n=1 Tax=Hymenoscyphus fraxineus TaxID=746836 RepID=A0A9N9KTT1_9HELO|nr:hypothetical protein HYFRA_00005676 [Hymenoscyphus fraxineus]